jgi:hypothetical protein
LDSCTIYDNASIFNTPEGSAVCIGGGIYNTSAAQMSVINTIIAGNLSLGADDVFGPVLDLGFNLIGTTNQSSGWTSSKLLGNNTSPLNPGLVPLTGNLLILPYHGGPTPTLALLPTSRAIDQGSSSLAIFNGISIDQRGYPRPVRYYSYYPLPSGGDGSDIGAFELARPRLSINPYPPHRLFISWSENQPPTGGQIPAPFYGMQVSFPGNPIIPSGWTNFNGFVRPMGGLFMALDEIGSGPVLYQLNSGVTPQYIPGPTTLSASNITTASATLYASDIPVGSNTVYWFQYGTDTSYTNGITVTNNLATSTNPASLSCSIAGLSPATQYHFQVVVTDDWGAQYGGDTNFTTPSPPAAATLAATSIASGSAQLNGTVNPNFGDTTWWFEYGYDTNYSIANTASAVVSASNTNAVPVNILAGGLSPLTVYHCQLVASNSAGVSYGGDQQFTTQGPPPMLVTLAASSISTTSAVLNGTVNGNGTAIAGYFQYGTDASYGSDTSGNQFFSSNANYFATAEYSTSISGLTPNTTYHYRILAFNGSSEGFGADTNFTTATPSQPPPTVMTLAPTSTTKTSAVLNGSVNPNGDNTTAYFEYGTSTNYGLSTTMTGIGTNMQSDFTATITFSGSQGAIHYRIDAFNSGGTNYGADTSF